jgi:DNA repair protein RecO (recombination protein O)
VPRSFVYQALALRVKPSGESNREAWFFTAEGGIVKATVFGGPKSRLRSHVAPFHDGNLWIYHDPVRDSRKVSDFDVQSWRPGIRECWERAMAADAVAETILASQGGGGNWQETLKFTGEVLDLLDGAAAGTCPRIAAYFLWRWAQILGVKPDLSVCASCACEVKREELIWYSARKEALFCEKCAKDGDSLLRLSPGGRLWLKGIESLPPAALERVSLDTLSLEQARALSQAVLAAVLGKRLATWDGI